MDRHVNVISRMLAYFVALSLQYFAHAMLVLKIVAVFITYGSCMVSFLVFWEDRFV